MEKKINHGRFVLEKKTKVQLQNAKVVSCEMSRGANKIVVIGQSNGVFGVFKSDTLEAIHSFQISENKIDSITINLSGEWIGLASK